MSADEGNGLGAERLRKWRDVAEASAATVKAPKVTGDWHPVARSVVADQAQVILALLDEVDRLTRERDEAWWRFEVLAKIRNVRAALGDDLTSGRDQAARPSSTPKRSAEHTPRPTDWTYDSPAVQPNEHNDEESDR